MDSFRRHTTDGFVSLRQPALLEAHGVAVAFGRTSVLVDVDLEVRQGESLALVGANGAGKTTLLRCLAGVLKPNRGDVLWLGQPVRRRRRGHCPIGLAAHERLLYRDLTARENLLFAARMHGLANPRRLTEEWLTAAGLTRQADRLAVELSQGQRQRLAVCRAVLHEPAVLLLDEPFAGLDAQGIAWLGDLLRQWPGAARAVCFSSHDLATVANLAERVVRLRSGRIEPVSLAQLPSARAA